METRASFQLMRMINAENKSSIVPMLDPNILENGRLNIRAHQLDDDYMKGLVTYVLQTEALTAIDIDVCVKLMGRIDEDTREGLVDLMDRCALTRGEDIAGDEHDECLILKDLLIKNDEIRGIADYIANSTKALSLLEPPIIALRIMAQIENDKFEFGEELAKRLQKCVLSYFSSGHKGRREGRLDLSEIDNVQQERIDGLGAFLRRSKRVIYLM